MIASRLDPRRPLCWNRSSDPAMASMNEGTRPAAAKTRLTTTGLGYRLLMKSKQNSSGVWRIITALANVPPRSSSGNRTCS